MKRNLLTMVLGAAAIASAVSCSEKENEGPVLSERVPMQFTAGTPSLDTKTAIASDGKSVLWSEGDIIAVFDGQTNKFELVDGAGTSSGKFNGFALPDTDCYALYPYSEDASMSGSVISAALPSVQYSTADGTFDTMLNPAVAKADGTGLEFDHVAGMLKINLEGVDGAVKSISLTADKNLAGDYTVNMSSEPYTAAAVTSDAENTGVQLVAANDGNLAAGPYYIVVLPGKYTDLKLTVNMADGSTATGSLAFLEIAARDIKETTIGAEEVPGAGFGFAATEDLTFSYKGAAKTYTVNAPTGTAWTLAADSEDVTLEPASGNGTAQVKVTLPYSKYIYDKDYTLTLSADAEEDQTLVITQQSCVDPNQSDPIGMITTDGTLTAEGASAMVKTYDKFKYGTFVWTFSDVNLTSGYFLINNWEGDSNLVVRFGDDADDATGFTNNAGDPIYPLHVMSAGGEYQINGNTVCFGFENGWGGHWGYTGYFPKGDYPATVNELKTVKLVMKPVDRVGGQNSGWGTKTLSRELYINDVLVITNQDGTDTRRYNTGDIWQDGSTHEGFQYEFGIAGDSDDPYKQTANGTMTIESFEYIPYTAE